MEQKNKTLEEKLKTGVKNWAIDTSAKIAVFAPLLASMEAYNGLDAKQIIGARTTSAIIDTFVVRAYTKLADYSCKKCSVDPKQGGIKAWAIDTASMILTHAPVYATILAINGADLEQIGMASLMGAAIATIASRPFRKYALFPWRKYWNYKE